MGHMVGVTSSVTKSNHPGWSVNEKVDLEWCVRWTGGDILLVEIKNTIWDVWFTLLLNILKEIVHFVEVGRVSQEYVTLEADYFKLISIKDQQTLEEFYLPFSS